MKATEQYFPVVLFIMLYKVFQLLCLLMKGIELYLARVLFVCLLGCT